MDMPSHFDPAKATSAYIESLGPELLQRAALYTVGNHWLLLWGLVVSALATLIVVRSRWLERFDQRLKGRARSLRTFAVCAAFMLLYSLISLPWSIYSDWWRERSYGRSSQPLADFLQQGVLELIITTPVASLFLVGVYALLRRSSHAWWLWSGALFALATSALLLFSPLYIEPLFNEFRPLPQGEVRAALLPLAREAGVDEARIFVYDGSRQSNNFTANVSGIGRSARIAISDVALKDASLDEVVAVTGHEIGHYVHGRWRLIGASSMLAMLLFFLADRLYTVFARGFGSSARIEEATGIPVLLFIVTLFAALATPLLNTLIRGEETWADRYSLEHANLPDALATALLKTAEYRDPQPNAVQEFLFYSHPSIENRVHMAMEWKAAHYRRG